MTTVMAVQMYPEPVESSNNQRNDDGTGDNVMAELQSKLKGRGRINPTHTTSIRLTGGGGGGRHGGGGGTCGTHESKEATKTKNAAPPKDSSNSTTTITTNSKTTHSSDRQTTDHAFSSSGKSVKMMKLRIENTSPDTDGHRPTVNSYSPTTIKVDVTESLGHCGSDSLSERKKSVPSSPHHVSSSFREDSKGVSTGRKYSAPSLLVNRAGPVTSSKGLDSEAKTGRPAQGSGAMGVRELARIFSTRSKEETNERVTHRKTAPKGTHWAISSQSSVPFTSSSSSSSKTEDKTTCRSKTVKERSKTDLNNDTNKSVETTNTIKEEHIVSSQGTDHRYENMFGDDWAPPTTRSTPAKPSEGSERGSKRPVPTPRKGNSPSASTPEESRHEIDESDNNDNEYVYELIEEYRKETKTTATGGKEERDSPSSSNLKELQSEIELLEDIINLPPLGEDKATTEEAATDNTSNKTRAKVSKSSSSVSAREIPRRDTPKLLKELRKGVVTDVETTPEEEYIKMSSVRPLLLSLDKEDEENEYHIPVVPYKAGQRSNTAITSNDRADITLSSSTVPSSNSVVSSSSVMQEGERPVDEEEEQNQYMTMRHPVTSPPPPVPRPQSTQEEEPVEEQNQYMTMRHPVTSPPPPVLRSRSTQGKGGQSSSGWKRSQGSIFAQEMINYMDQQESLYCKIPERRPLPFKLSEACPTIESLWDDSESGKYIDIYDIPTGRPPPSLKQASPFVARQQLPPPIPNRPLIGPAAPKQLTPNVIFSSKTGAVRDRDFSQSVPNVELPLPPLVPPKSESMLREQGMLESVMGGGRGGVGKGKSKSEKKAGKILNKSETPPPSVKPENAKNLIRALKKEVLATRSDPNLPRRPLPLPSSSSFSSRKANNVGTPTAGMDYTSLDSKDQQLLQHSSSSPNVLLNGTSPIPIVSSTNHSRPVAVTTPSPPSPPSCLERKGVVRRKHGRKHIDISRKINRDSLAVILCNRDIITKQLKQRSLERVTGPMARLPSGSPPSTKRGRETLVHSLGQILVEISDLLQEEGHYQEGGGSGQFQEDSLVKMIENELNLTLHNNPAYLIASNNATAPEDDDDDYHVVITDEDVQDVVKYFDDNWTNEDFEDSGTPKGQGKSHLSRSFSDAMLLESLDERPRLDSVSSLPETNRHDNESLSDDNGEEYMEILDVTHSVTVAAENLARGRGNSVNASLVSSDRMQSLPNGVGYFTSSGGIITSKSSGVVVEVPPGVVPKGRRQKLWFEVHQTVYRETDPEELYTSYSNSVSENKSDNVKKKESKIQLSPIVFIGPPEAVLQKPLKINIPHCVPIDTSTWHLKVSGRGHNSRSDEWVSLTQASGHFLPLPGTNKKSLKNSTYQIHPNYARIKTKMPGCFRLVGRPVGQNPNKIVKKMVCSIYTETLRDGHASSDDSSCVRVKVFFVNAVLDSVEALDRALASEGYTCLERNIPMLVYGNKTDLEVSISADSYPQGSTTLHSQVIPYVMFWRATRIGNARVTFDVDSSVLKRTKLLKLRVCQSSKEALDMEFMLP